MSQYIHLLSCVLLSLIFYSFYAEKIYNPTHEKDVAIFILFFYMMEVVPFQKEPSFWVWGLRAYTVLMVLGIKKTKHFRFNHFDALRKPLNNQWSFIRYANTTIALLYLIQYYLQTKHRLLSSLSRP